MSSSTNKLNSLSILGELSMLFIPDAIVHLNFKATIDIIWEFDKTVGFLVPFNEFWIST